MTEKLITKDYKEAMERLDPIIAELLCELSQDALAVVLAGHAMVLFQGLGMSDDEVLALLSDMVFTHE